MSATAQPKSKLSFEQFLDRYPDDGRYELVNGELARILATRCHEDVVDFIADELKAEVRRLDLNYRVSDRIVICTFTADGTEQGRHPDVSVVDRAVWETDRDAYSALLDPLQLAIEVVSTNWEDDRSDKLDEYVRLGIPEFWIVDYLALGPRSSLGNPKTPGVLAFLLDDSGQYREQLFTLGDRIVSQTFPQLAMTVDRIVQA
jgi:Uma2 family endonuclease